MLMAQRNERNITKYQHSPNGRINISLNVDFQHTASIQLQIYNSKKSHNQTELLIDGIMK